MRSIGIASCSERRTRTRGLDLRRPLAKQMEGTILALGKAIMVVSEQDNLFTITAVSTSSRLSEADSARLAQAQAYLLAMLRLTYPRT